MSCAISFRVSHFSIRSLKIKSWCISSFFEHSCQSNSSRLSWYIQYFLRIQSIHFEKYSTVEFKNHRNSSFSSYPKVNDILNNIQISMTYMYKIFHSHRIVVVIIIIFSIIRSLYIDISDSQSVIIFIRDKFSDKAQIYWIWTNPYEIMIHFSNIEQSLSKDKRDREFEYVQLLSNAKWKRKFWLNEEILMTSIENKAERAFQGEFTTETRLSKAQIEMIRTQWQRRNTEISLHELVDSMNPGTWHSIRHINCLIRLKGKNDFLQN